MNDGEPAAAPRNRRTIVSAVTVGILVLASLLAVQLARDPAPPVPAFGASVWPDDGESMNAAIERTSTMFGGLQVLRYFEPGPPIPWGSSGASQALPSRVPRIYSFKLDPAEVIAGSHDAAITAWADSVPRDQTVYWSYFHEPEENVAKGEFTAAQWRQAFAHVMSVVGGRPNLVATPILMGWTLDPRSGRDIDDWLVPGAQVLGWDTYTHGQLDSSAAFSRDRGIPWLVAEYANGAAHKKTVSDAEYLKYLEADDPVWDVEPKPLAVALFNTPVGGEYRLDDRPRSAAWWADRIDR